MKPPLEIIQKAQAGDTEALRLVFKVTDNLRSRGYTFKEIAKFFEIEERDFDALMIEAEERISP